MEIRKSRAFGIFLSLAGTPVDGEHEPGKYRVPQFNNVDLDVPGLFTSRTERRTLCKNGCLYIILLFVFKLASPTSFLRQKL